MTGRRDSRLILIFGIILCLGSFASACPAKTYTSALSQEHADGVVAHIIKKVMDKLDLSVEIRLAPFARRLRWMKKGKIDIMGGLLKRPEREVYIYYVSPPYVQRNRKVFYVQRGDEDQIRCYQDLYGLTIGTKIHSQYFPRFDHDERLKKEAVSSIEQNFKKLLAGRIDAVIYSNRSGYAQLMKMGITDQVGVARYAYTLENPVYIGISKASPLMAKKEQITAVVSRMVESGEMARLIHDYYQFLPTPLHYPKQADADRSDQ